MSKLKKILKLNTRAAIISELGINHFGKLELAKKMIDNIFSAGGKIVKNQTHDLDHEMSIEAKKIKPGNANTSIYNVIKKNMMSFNNEIKLKKYAESKGMLYISTPFSKQSAKKLNKIGVKLFKIGSGEFNNLPLIKEVASYKKPMILSTGMNDMSSIKKTYELLKKLKADFAFMHCISDYPVKDKDLQLNVIKALKKKFPDIVIGYSDHSKSIVPSILSISYGAEIIEKHFAFDKSQKGPDIICSMDKNDLFLLNQASELVSNNKTNRVVTKNEKNVSKFAFASVVSIKNINKGEYLTLDNIWVKRPGTGFFKAQDLNKVLGKKAKKKIFANIQIKKNDF